MGKARVWLPSLLVGGGVAMAWALSAGSLAPLTRPMLITLVIGLAALSVSGSLYWSMGLGRESIALRFVAVLPMFLSILLIVALMLDADFRGRAGGLGR